MIFEGKAHYLRDQVEAFAAAITSNWTMAEAYEALQLTRYQLRQLLDAGVFRTLQSLDSLNRNWVIDKAQRRELIEILWQKARNTHPPAGAVSMAGIQRQGYSIAELVLVMLAGKLGYCILWDETYPLSFRQFVEFGPVGEP